MGRERQAYRFWLRNFGWGTPAKHIGIKTPMSFC
jgi:hypothetical protein